MPNNFLFNFRTPGHKAAVALLAAGLSSVAAAQAFDAPPPPDVAEAPHHQHGLPPHIAALNLSDAQKAQIQALHDANREQHQAQREAGRALHESLRALNPGMSNYMQEVDRIATQAGQQMAQHIRDKAAQRAQEWAILTPLQQSQLAAMPQLEPGKWRHGPRGKRG